MGVTQSYVRPNVINLPFAVVDSSSGTTVATHYVDIRPPPGENWQVLFASSVLFQYTAGPSVSRTRIEILMRDEISGVARVMKTINVHSATNLEDRPTVTVGSSSDGPLILTHDIYLQAGHRIENNTLTAGVTHITGLMRKL